MTTEEAGAPLKFSHLSNGLKLLLVLILIASSAALATGIKQREELEADLRWLSEEQVGGLEIQVDTLETELRRLRSDLRLNQGP